MRLGKPAPVPVLTDYTDIVNNSTIYPETYPTSVFTSVPRPINPAFTLALEEMPPKNVITTTPTPKDLILTTFNNTNVVSGIAIKTILSDKIGVLPMVNVAVNYIPKYQTNANGEIEIKGLQPLDQVSFSFLGYETIILPAAAVPSKLTMKEVSTTLPGATVVIPTKKAFPWWKLILGGFIIYGGYRYIYDPKTKKIVQTKI